MRAHAVGEPEHRRLHLPFLVVTLLNTGLITAVMTYLVMPRLARVMRPFLAGRRPTR